METANLIKKLRFQRGQRVLILNAPDGYIAGLSPLLQGIEVHDTADGEFDFVQLFVKSVSELDEHAPAAIKAVKYDGLLWICYPKQTSGIKTDINRDTGWSIVQKAGLRPVMQVAIDDTWSALRYRPAERVGS